MNNGNCIDTIHQPRNPILASGTSRMRNAAQEFLTALFDLFAAWSERARQIRDLQQMSDRELKDIGLSRADVEREASIPFWRA